jgi:hypothetical protein
VIFSCPSSLLPVLALLDWLFCSWNHLFVSCFNFFGVIWFSSFNRFLKTIQLWIIDFVFSLSILRFNFDLRKLQIGCMLYLFWPISNHTTNFYQRITFDLMSNQQNPNECFVVFIQLIWTTRG